VGFGFGSVDWCRYQRWPVLVLVHKYYMVLKQKTQLEKWFPDKKFVQMLACKGCCQLNFSARLAYSVLVYKLRKDDCGLSVKRLALLTGLDRQTSATTSIQQLTGLGLVVQRQGTWWATPPTEQQRKWFARNKKTGVPWCDTFCTFHLLRMTPACPLTARANGVLWSLWSLWLASGSVGRCLLYNQTFKGLARLNSLSVNCLKSCLTELAKHGLLHQSGPTIELLPPQQEQLSWWLATGKKQQKTRQQEFNLASQFKGLKDDNIDNFNRFGKLMVAAKYQQKEVLDYWRWVTSRMKELKIPVGNEKLQDFSFLFDSLFKDCETIHQHTPNPQGPKHHCSIHLLKTKTDEVLLRMAGSHLAYTGN
jgi:hypothetical protein